jgi:hypothetical protein
VSENVGGFFSIELPEVQGCFRATIEFPNGGTVVTPASGFFDFCTSADVVEIQRDFIVTTPDCGLIEPGRCWMTGGGAKFSNITNSYLGDVTSSHSFGGNVNPGCSPTAGQGGQWNDVSHLQKLHFQGFTAKVVRCGNIDDFPPGSTSPKTPFNFIEFTGTGRVEGIKGNKADYPLVYYFGRVEDRNEPGSSGVEDGNLKDRYFLHVWTNQADPAGSTIILVDLDGNPNTVDPVTITKGNLQLHISSCDGTDFVSVLSAAPTMSLAPSDGASPTPDTIDPAAGVWMARSGQNPTSTNAIFRFGLPRAASVTFRMFDVSGRQLREITNASLDAGDHTAVWDLRDSNGVRVAPGMYFARMTVDGLVKIGTVAVVQ